MISSYVYSNLTPIAHSNVAWLNNVNADDYKTTGYYPIQAGTNVPSTWCILEVIATRSDTVIQYAYGSAGRWFRQLRNTWTEWEKIPTRSEVDALNNRILRSENLLTFTDYVDGTSVGVTFTRKGNAIYATGTGTAEGIHYIDRALKLIKGTYLFGGVYSTTPWIQLMNEAGTTQIGNSNNSNVFTASSDMTIMVRYHISNGVAVNEVTAPFFCRIS